VRNPPTAAGVTSPALHRSDGCDHRICSGEVTYRIGVLAARALPVVTILLLAPLPGFTEVARAGSLADVASDVGIAQSDQSFNTLVFDYNGDGIQDFLYSPQNDPAGRQLWQGNAGGTFTLVAHLKGSVTTDQHGCTTADFDHNGLPDVYCALGAIHGSREKANPLWLQEPADNTHPTTWWSLDERSGAQDGYGRGYSATRIDANGDGWPDLFVDSFYPRPDGIATPDRLFINLGDDASGNWMGFADEGSASGVEQEEGGRGCDFATDFNGDGKQDIVFCGTNHLFFYRGNGDGTFTDVTAQKLGANINFVSDVRLVNLNPNLDPYPDLIYIRNGQEGVRFGSGSGLFGPPVMTHALTFGRTLDVADLNGDGIPDIYALEANGLPGCSTCLTNYPDYVYLGGKTALGKYTSGLAGTFTLSTPNQDGSGDTVNAIRLPNGRTDMIVGNGANLVNGPLQLWQWQP
jgi:FG-GAP-like repeat